MIAGSDREDLIRQAELFLINARESFSSSEESPNKENLDNHFSRGQLSLDTFRGLSGHSSATSHRLGIVASDIADLEAKVVRAVKRLSDPNCKQINDVSGIYYTSEPAWTGCANRFSATW